MLSFGAVLAVIIGLLSIYRLFNIYRAIFGLAPAERLRRSVRRTSLRLSADLFIITNSIKYTQKGSVKIIARKDPRGVKFMVQDTGIGISKGDQERVFDKFFRSEDYRTREANGTGMGLYITMKLARIIHAEMSLTSELNKGSVFTIFVPNLEPEAATGA